MSILRRHVVGQVSADAIYQMLKKEKAMAEATEGAAKEGKHSTEWFLTKAAMIVNGVLGVAGATLASLAEQHQWLGLLLIALAAISNGLAQYGYTKGRSIVKAKQLELAARPTQALPQ